MNIQYKDSKSITAEELSSVFQLSGITRPYQDLDRLERMITHSDLLITAWDEEKMVGVARAVTDFSYCCYLSDLAVDASYQKYGIGKELVRRVQEQAGEECALLLISAPSAVDYYPKIGFAQSDRAFLIPRAK
ncbi:GNAT family N-acetyltransferase [Paenibacillus sp. MMS18-CY102]|uniref:GNAT family N-acetyltransferase n=1 Tax=Paenibacillus sp. MMS18-CY102 TaxID=2682849 RepID=UPI0013651B1E|nr:GNAT family N-acetyltransferase [Paenibacillus sp. MMS18-CY102]MWC26884.1 GNAT family N-acetyltransferase [Paenibacillus sp. MMS18-CY102]